MKSSIGSVLATLAFVVLALVVSFQQGWIVTGYQAERRAALMGISIALHDAQQHYAGIREAGGCFSFEPSRFQPTVNDYQFTAKELGQSTEKLLCQGFTIPADFSNP